MGRKSVKHKRREQILWALYECLAKKGHEKVTINTIAAQAKLSPGIIHYYFKSKDEIVSMLAEAIIEKYGDIFDLRLNEAGLNEQPIDILVEFLVDIILDHPLNHTFYNMVQMSFEREQLQSVMQTMLDSYRNKLSEAIIKSGANRDNPLLGAALLAVTEGITLQVLIDPSAFKRDDVRQIISASVQSLSKAV
ncbi:TetR family transcriptional regulator [Desulfobacterales bacterium]|nr:TetR family transcriptional regulator [Desulfobacterales bacterium]